MIIYSTQIKKQWTLCIILFALSILTAIPFSEVSSQTLLASYPLLSNAQDATGHYGNMILAGSPPLDISNGVCINGVYGNYSAQTPDITTLTPTDFNVKIDFSITQYGIDGAPVLMGGRSYRWIGIYVGSTGRMGVKYNNSYWVWSTTTVNRGEWHSAIVSYVGGTVQLFLDGNKILSSVIGSLTTASNYNFTTTDYSNGRVLNGCIRNLQIYNGNVNINSYTLSVNASDGSITKNPDLAEYDAGSTVLVSQTPDRGYVFTGWSGDATGTDNPLTVIMNANKTIQANYEVDPEFEIAYRTAEYEKWATAVDQKGKLKSVKRKADKVYFAFELVTDTTGILALDFGVLSTGTIIRKGTIDTFGVFTNVKKYKDTLPTISGETLKVEGIGAQGKILKAKYAWGPKGKSTLVTVYTTNAIGYPMPNLHNVGEELFPLKNIPSGYYSKTNPLIVGIPHGAKGANSVTHKAYQDVQKSMVKVVKKNNALHADSLAVRCLDSLDGKKKKPMDKQQKSLPPDKHNSKLFAEVLTLKLNVAASLTEKFPSGIGQLTFNDLDFPDNIFNGLLVDSIVMIADSMLSCLSVTTLPTATLGELYPTVKLINEAFAGTTIDTISFVSQTKLTGVRTLFDVEYLHPTAGIIPRIVQNFAGIENDVPVEFALYQTYPNPFNPSTNFGFRIANFGLVSLKIYNMLGQEVTTLLNREEMDGGEYEVPFEAVNLPSGVYFYRIKVESVNDEGTKQTFTEVKRMLLLK
ncbi:MAG: T9SS type A sorting domain-containing protein [Ignavibacteriae bacterium]|nr:T9SS type A sorting domain-containing protein [Ignavibacteriota bacterium]